MKYEETVLPDGSIRITIISKDGVKFEATQSPDDVKGDDKNKPHRVAPPQRVDPSGQTDNNSHQQPVRVQGPERLNK